MNKPRFPRFLLSTTKQHWSLLEPATVETLNGTRASGNGKNANCLGPSRRIVVKKELAHDRSSKNHLWRKWSPDLKPVLPVHELNKVPGRCDSPPSAIVQHVWAE